MIPRAPTEMGIAQLSILKKVFESLVRLIFGFTVPFSGAER
jgi:hypothetical protein